ncbi:hypothetical protein [Nocardioides plantarum]|uniref:LPXTG-motif cell wall-anchored protein n=1 Tax=Nocardioides plantarum TaxID=29299 RepID=A0ABV5K7V5_9ACTN|nr:hypothetical protein [Nocardioides plantarum]
MEHQSLVGWVTALVALGLVPVAYALTGDDIGGAERVVAVAGALVAAAAILLYVRARRRAIRRTRSGRRR